MVARVGFVIRPDFIHQKSENEFQVFLVNALECAVLLLLSVDKLYAFDGGLPCLMERREVDTAR